MGTICRILHPLMLFTFNLKSIDFHHYIALIADNELLLSTQRKVLTFQKHGGARSDI